MKTTRLLLLAFGFSLTMALPSEACNKQEMLKKYDVNGDGQIDDTEKAAIKKKWEGRRAEMMKKFDANGDGTLDDNEKAALRKEMKARRAERKHKQEKSDQPTKPADSQVPVL